jgi:hypothetical protein
MGQSKIEQHADALDLTSMWLALWTTDVSVQQTLAYG